MEKQFKIINGDCLVELQKLIEDGIVVDMILTDLPYGMTQCEWDSVIPFDKMWDLIHKITKENAAICLFGTEPFSSFLRMSNIKEFRYDWVWKKNNTSGFLHAKKQPLRNHELISVFYVSQPIYNPIKEKRELNEQSINRFKYKFDSDKGKNTIYEGAEKFKFSPDDLENSYPKSVKEFKCVSVNDKIRFHPTQKPVELLEYLIKTYTNKNDVVLDFTAGSLSTAIACLHTDRKCICIEKK